MSPKAREEYVEALVERYRYANRRTKSFILDELCLNCGYHRKYAIEKINTFNAKVRRRKPGRPARYTDPELLEPLKEIWLAANMPASKRLVAMIPHWLVFFDNLNPHVRSQLLNISAPTIDRILK